MAVGLLPACILCLLLLAACIVALAVFAVLVADIVKLLVAAAGLGLFSFVPSGTLPLHSPASWWQPQRA